MVNTNIFKTIRENNKPNLGKILLHSQVTGLTDVKWILIGINSNRN